jgi:serine/threonine protein kinase
MSLIIGSSLGTYEIAPLIGTGGTGEVYRARDTNLKREVAIKVYPLRAVEESVPASSGRHCAVTRELSGASLCRAHIIHTS